MNDFFFWVLFSLSQRARSRMDVDVAQTLKKAKLIKVKLDALDRSNAANWSLPGCGPGSSSDWTRGHLIAWYKLKVSNWMILKAICRGWALLFMEERFWFMDMQSSKSILVYLNDFGLWIWFWFMGISSFMDMILARSDCSSILRVQR